MKKLTPQELKMLLRQVSRDYQRDKDLQAYKREVTSCLEQCDASTAYKYIRLMLEQRLDWINSELNNEDV